MVSTVSILGVDDTVSPADLADISDMYPFVEWGINLCSGEESKPGYPSEIWLEGLLGVSDKLRLRGVLHGRWERDILDGNLSLRVEELKLWNALHRIQVDIRKGHRNIIEALQLISDKEVILQSTLPNHLITGSHLDAHLLLPRSMAFEHPEYCGYSLSDTDIDLIMNSKSKSSYWVSVEGFRNNGCLDLFKVENFLDSIEEKITEDNWFRALLQTNDVKRRLSEHPKRA
jgi:hypothetical protein